MMLGRDKIQLTGMVFYGFHGVGQSERELGQRFVVDIEAERDLRAAGMSDALEDTVDYSLIYRIARDAVEGPGHTLLESVAEAIAQRVLAECEVDAVRVRLKKPEVPIQGSVLAHVGVEVFRQRDQSGR